MTKAPERVRRAAAGLALLGGLCGCASPEPVLYPNAQYQRVGEARAEADIAACQELAEAAGARGELDAAGQAAAGTAVGGVIGAATGAAGGAVVGSPGTGAAIGAASGAAGGLIRSLLRRPAPSPAFRNFVERCLRERGYEPMGWD